MRSLWRKEWGPEIEAKFLERGIAFSDDSVWNTFYVRNKAEEGAILGVSRVDGEGRVHYGYVKVFGTHDDWVAARERYAPFHKGDRYAFALPGSDSIYFHFPADRRVRALHHVTNPRRLKHYLHSHVPGFDANSRRVRAGKTVLDLLRYKPERRAVLRARIALRDERSGAKEIVSHVVRVHADRSGLNASRVLPTLAKAVSFRLPDTLHYDADSRIAIHSWVEGKPVLDDWAAGGRVDLALAAGRALREVHEASVPDTLPVRRSHDTDQRARRVVRDLESFLPGIGKDVAALLEGESRRPAEQCLVHGDFYYAQIVCRGESDIGVVDWDECRFGYAVEDVANFLAHLNYLELESRIPGGFARILEREFLEGYGTPPDGLARETALQLVLLAMRPIRSLATRWEGRSRAILRRAAHVLDDGRGIQA
ncbi:MAG: aminoglycoside phosphotransferase family protein [Gemmatimonadetes bacterium]|nr:aminoglycoside phosphotransferase family protein [Gemmatimonadota bacterium]